MMSEIVTEEELPRYSLRSMLLAMTVICVLLTPVHWYGIKYVIPMLFSLALLRVTWNFYVSFSEERKALATIALGLMPLCLFSVIFSIPFFLHSLLNSLALLASALRVV